MKDQEKNKGFYVTTIRVGEGIWIDDIFVSINKIKAGHQVSLGIFSETKRKISKARIETKDPSPSAELS